MTPRSWLRRFYIFAGIEVAAGSTVAAAIGLEIVMGADWGWILVSVGSLGFACGSGLWAKAYVGTRGR